MAESEEVDDGVTPDGGAGAGGEENNDGTGGGDPTPAGPFDGFLQPDGSFRENWADSLPEELKDAGATLKNYSAFPEVVQELHRLNRAVDGAIKVPGEDASPEEVNAFREAIGAGTKPEDYEVGDGEEFLAKWAAENGVPKKAVESLQALRKSEAEAQEAAAKEEDEKAITEAKEALFKAWGDDVGEKSQRALKAAQQLGVKLDDYADPDLAMAFEQIGRWFEEDPNMLQGRGVPDSLFSMVAPNPGAQALDIINNPHNQDHERYWRGDQVVVRKVQDLMARTAK